MRSIIILALISLNVVLIPKRQSPEINIESESKIEFSIDNAGIEIKGTLNANQVEIKFDANDLKASSIVATADPATINTGIAIRDKHLKKQDYFDVAHFPEIRLTSRSFKRIGKNKFSGDFDLTIKNVTRSVKILFEAKPGNNVTQYQGNFQINRLDFNLGEKSSILSELVTITISTNQQR